MTTIQYRKLTHEERLMPVVEALQDRFFSVGGRLGLMTKAEAAEIALALDRARVTLSPPVVAPEGFDMRPGAVNAFV